MKAKGENESSEGKAFSFCGTDLSSNCTWHYIWSFARSDPLAQSQKKFREQLNVTQNPKPKAKPKKQNQITSIYLSPCLAPLITLPTTPQYIFSYGRGGGHSQRCSGAILHFALWEYFWWVSWEHMGCWDQHGSATSKVNFLLIVLSLWLSQYFLFIPLLKIN